MQSLLIPAGPAARQIADVGMWLSVGALAVFVLAMLLMLHAVRAAPAPADVRRWVIGGGLVLPALLVALLVGWSVANKVRLAQPAPPSALVISITAHMWWWEVSYHDPASGRATVVTANEVHLPAARPVRLALQSADVIHSFWVPELAGKRDLVPGRVTHLLIEADRPGVYRGRCAEYCGQQHTRMAMAVVAHSAEDFERWLAAQREPAAEPAASAAETVRQGRQAFVEVGCIACHRIDGLGGGTLPTQGPDLSHVASRLTLGAGQRSMGDSEDDRRATLRQWITQVQRLKPGARMPSFEHLDTATLDALAAYLASLK